MSSNGLSDSFNELLEFRILWLNSVVQEHGLLLSLDPRLLGWNLVSQSLSLLDSESICFSSLQLFSDLFNFFFGFDEIKIITLSLSSTALFAQLVISDLRVFFIIFEVGHLVRLMGLWCLGDLDELFLNRLFISFLGYLSYLILSRHYLNLGAALVAIQQRKGVIFMEALIVELVLIFIFKCLQNALVLLSQSRRSSSLSWLERYNLVWKLQIIIEIVFVLSHVEFIFELAVIIKLLKREIWFLILNVVMRVLILQ